MSDPQLPEIIEASPPPSPSPVEVAVREPNKTEIQASSGMFGLEPEAMVSYATRVANVLKNIIEKQGLCSTISGRQFVKVEGWITLGNLLGILPEEEWVREHEDGSYEVMIKLVRTADGKVMSRASALCGMDERRWKTADRYARRSMAATRATGKAFRQAFSWIMTLAGYEATPAEEMPEAVPQKDGVDVYIATREQKQMLNFLFKKHAIKDVEKMKFFNEEAKRAHLTVCELEAGLKELIAEGKI